MHLFLIGYRGSGKTTLARALSPRLHRPWVDTDVLIEQFAGKTIRQIFAEDGEGYFRDLESKIIEQVAAGVDQIISLGGGAILRPENRACLRRTGYTIWLTAPPEMLLARIEYDPSTGERRPNLTSLPPLDEIRTVLAARQSFYEESADWIVDTSSCSLDELTQGVDDWFRQKA